MHTCTRTRTHTHTKSTRATPCTHTHTHTHIHTQNPPGPRHAHTHTHTRTHRIHQGPSHPAASAKQHAMLPIRPGMITFNIQQPKWSMSKIGGPAPSCQDRVQASQCAAGLSWVVPLPLLASGIPPPPRKRTLRPTPPTPQGHESPRYCGQGAD